MILNKFRQKISQSGQLLRLGISEFPLAWLAASIASILLLVLIHQEPREANGLIAALSAALLLLPLAIAQGILRRDDFGRLSWIMAGISPLLALGFGFWFYQVLEGTNLEVHAMQVTAIFSLAILVVPLARWRIFQAGKAPADWVYALGFTLTIAAVMGTLLAGGISLTIWSLEALFDLDIDSKVYGDVWVLGGMLFGLTYWLGAIVEYWENQLQKTSFVNRLVEWVGRPLLTVYYLVIAAYAIKIALAGELPRGVLSGMVLGYGIIGLLVLLLLAWIVAGQRKWDRLFVFSFPLPLVLFLIAIMRRVSEYGWTESRLLLLMSMIVVVSGLIWTLRQGVLSTGKILGLLAIMSFSFVLGTWGVPGLAMHSQVNRYQTLLSQNNLWKNGQLQAQGQKLTDSLQWEIDDLGEHLLDRYGIQSVRHLDARLQKLDTASSWEIRDSLRAWTGVSARYSRSYNYFNWDVSDSATIPVQGMSSCRQVNSSSYRQSTPSNQFVSDSLHPEFAWQIAPIMDSLAKSMSRNGVSYQQGKRVIILDQNQNSVRHQLVILQLTFEKNPNLHWNNLKALICRAP